MRPETRKKLDNLAKSECYFTRLTLAVLVLLPLLALVWFQPPLSRDAHQGEVVWSARRVDSETGRPYAQMQVRLDGGRVVRVSSRLTTLPPEKGATVRVIEERSWMGYSMFLLEPVPR